MKSVDTLVGQPEQKKEWHELKARVAGLLASSWETTSQRSARN